MSWMRFALPVVNPRSRPQFTVDEADAAAGEDDWGAADREVVTMCILKPAEQLKMEIPGEM
jgi:hypothetical protein